MSRLNPRVTHAWIIGADISSLAAAVYLIHDGHVPAAHIHIMVDDRQTTDEVGFTSYSIDRCTAHLLSSINNRTLPHKDTSDDMDMKTANEGVKPLQKTCYFAKHSGCKIRRIEQPVSQLRLADRKDILKVMLGDARNLDSKTVEDCFRGSFFHSELWLLFSTRFAMQPCHSALEFQRCLRKYLEEAEYCRMDSPVAALQVTESLRETLRNHLEKEGVDFWHNTAVRDLKLLTENSWTRISMIEAKREGKSLQISISSEDIVLVALGSASSGSLIGSNGSPPPPIPVRADRIMNASWSLWFRLWQYSPEFGNPTAFCTHLSESKVEAFTITLQDGGENLYRYLREQMGEDSSLAIPDSNWSLSIYPCQHRIGSEEWPKTYTIWGYGLTPERHGNYIQKPMCRCAGQEILSELISHLGPGFDGALSTSITIPRLIPLASASLMRRNRADRPQTIPKRMKNIGLIGMFSEVADETVCGVEYGIRTAQTAVYGLMGLHQSLPKVGINAVAEKYGSRE